MADIPGTTEGEGITPSLAAPAAAATATTDLATLTEAMRQQNDLHEPPDDDRHPHNGRC